MFYRVTADLIFTQQDEANDFYHDCDLALAKASVINPGEINQEQSTIILHRCFHDEDPVTPCIVISQKTIP